MVAEPSVEVPIEKEKGEPCILHSVPNCLSCRDTFGQQEKEDTDEGWLAHRLVFEKDYKGKDLMQRKDDPDDYLVIDPLERKKEAFKQEKEKRAQKSSISEVFIKRDRDRDPKDRHRDRRSNMYEGDRYRTDKGYDRDRDRERGRDRDRDRDRHR